MDQLKVLLLIFLLGFTACSGEKWNDCFEPHGNNTTEKRSLTPFSSIKVDGNFTVELVQDSGYFVEITAGKNFIHQIKTEVKNNQLVLEEDIACKFMRDQSRDYKMVIHCGELSSIAHFSGKKLVAKNLSSSRLEIDKWAGGGDLEIQLSCDSLFGRIHAGSGDLIFNGATHFAYIYQRGFGYIRNKNLAIDLAYVDKGGTGDCFLTVQDNVEIDFNSPGNLFIYGNPTQKLLRKKGDGSITILP